MKFPIHSHIHIQRFFVDIHGNIHGYIHGYTHGLSIACLWHTCKITKSTLKQFHEKFVTLRARKHYKSNIQHTLWAVGGYQERKLGVLYESRGINPPWGGCRKLVPHCPLSPFLLYHSPGRLPTRIFWGIFWRNAKKKLGSFRLAPRV